METQHKIGSEPLKQSFGDRTQEQQQEDGKHPHEQSVQPVDKEDPIREGAQPGHYTIKNRSSC